MDGTGNDRSIELEGLDEKVGQDFRDHVVLDEKELMEIEGYTTVNEILKIPNCGSVDDIPVAANEGDEHIGISKPFVSGTLFPQGTFGVVLNNRKGRYEIVGPGEWTTLWNYRCDFVVNNPVILHQNNPFSHGPITVVQIGDNQIGIAEKDGKAVFLAPGIHVFNDSQFRFLRFENVVSEHISHLDTHILQVKRGYLALVKCNNSPHLLSEGTHCFRLPLFEYDGQVLETQPLIRHETITRFQVNLGFVGLAWYKNEPIVFDQPGIYVRNSSDFIFESFEKADADLISLGSIKIITVSPGFVGVVFKPDLLIMQPGCHTFNDPGLTFEGFIDTKERCIQLRQHFDPDHLQNMNHEDMIICETREFVQVSILADLYYRIADPEKVVLTIGVREVDIDLRMNELGKAQLNAITRNTSLAEVAQSGMGTAGDGSSENKQEEEAPQLFEKVHDQFIGVLHDTCYDLYGIELINIRIESFKIKNKELENQIASQAIITAETESELANLRGKAEIAAAEQQRIAEVQRIDSEAYATNMKVRLDADNQVIIDKARAAAEAEVIKAQAQAEAYLKQKEVEAHTLLKIKEAEAQALLTQKTAEADALLKMKTSEAEGVRLLAAAEEERAQKLQSTELGRNIAMAEIYSQTMIQSMEGVQKLVYLPTEKGMFSFLDMQAVANTLTRYTGGEDDMKY